MKGMGTQPWAVEDGADHAPRALRLFWSEVARRGTCEDFPWGKWPGIWKGGRPEGLEGTLQTLLSPTARGKPPRPPPPPAGEVQEHQHGRAAVGPKWCLYFSGLGLTERWGGAGRLPLLAGGAPSWKLRDTRALTPRRRARCGDTGAEPTRGPTPPQTRPGPARSR